MIDLLRLTEDEILQICQSGVDTNTALVSAGNGTRVAKSGSRISHRNFVNFNFAVPLGSPAVAVVTLIGAVQATPSTFAGAPYYIGYLAYEVTGSGLAVSDQCSVGAAISDCAITGVPDVTQNFLRYYLAPAGGANQILGGEILPFPLVFNSLQLSLDIAAAGQVGIWGNFIGLQVYVK